MSLTQDERERVGQRAELTFKYNRSAGRHGWLRLTPAYSVKIVQEILNSGASGLVVLDPFSGTGTTTLCAANLGRAATSIEINPFLVWFGRAKLAQYCDEVLSGAAALAREIVQRCSDEKEEPGAPPPLANIQRWWPSDTLTQLCRLRTSLEATTRLRTPVGDLLRIAFCRTIITSSNAAFNHQSMSFKDGRSAQQPMFGVDHDIPNQFSKDVATVLAGAATNPVGAAEVIEGDSRELEGLVSRKYDLLITSPPYPNRMSYIRELRPYMYWLGFLNEARAAAELDWTAIGGTWGVATSRLIGWRPSGKSFVPRILGSSLAAIRETNGENRDLLATYVAKYFEDIWTHIQSVKGVIRPGGVVHYIVGNVTFYGVVVPVENIYAEMLEKLGFRNVRIETLRKRNSNKHLFEFDVTAVR